MVTTQARPVDETKLMDIVNQCVGDFGAILSGTLVAIGDKLGLFEGVSGFVGDFTVFETATRLPESARRLTEAGRDPGQPAFVAYGLGGGIVVRAGTPQWARQLEESALSLELPEVTKRIWELLAEGP